MGIAIATSGVNCRSFWLALRLVLKLGLFHADRAKPAQDSSIVGSVIGPLPLKRFMAK